METKTNGQVNKILQDHASLNLTAYLNASLSLHHHVNNAMLGIILGMLCLLTIIMNILVLVAVRKERTLHTVGNLYIVSLSLADLIVGATVMPLNLVYLLEDEWKLGRVVCQFWLVMDYVASTASIFNLFILCLDRYQSVRHPLRYLKYRTRGRATLMICFAWLLSMMWIIPILGWRMFANVDRKPELESKCDTDFRFVTWFKVLTAILNFYIPSFLMLWFYSQIFIAVREHYKQWESVTIAKVVADEDINVQSLRNQRTFCKMAEEDNLALQTYSQKEGMLDQYTLELPYNSRDTNEENGESGHDKSPQNRKTSFFKITKPKRKTVRDPHEVSSVNQEVNSDTPSKVPSLPLGILQHEENADLKMFVSVTDCNVLVPNSIANICEIKPNTDIHKHITILCNDDANAQSPVSQGSWMHNDGPIIDGSNTMTLRQTWQKFCEQSRQCVQNMRIHKERKAVRQLGFIIGAFMVCWIPYFITFMVMALCDTCVHHDLHMFTIWLGYINSTLNPFIYPLCNENFKRVFKKFFRIKQ
ncbi:hypothetical protein AMELA_G00008190 [Ameiurus melas]|uniref:Muscarinic acetylcholine receptor n=1 Tax=Ameiurus melas TaxID=219545 RepID=A0A7J6BJX8_AMEME|nr:hypothetical protein AMELA_G00008190 [Ameiurus melas]